MPKAKRKLDNSTSKLLQSWLIKKTNVNKNDADREGEMSSSTFLATTAEIITVAHSITSTSTDQLDHTRNSSHGGDGNTLMARPHQFYKFVVSAATKVSELVWTLLQ
jgi:hypothetical protein